MPSSRGSTHPPRPGPRGPAPGLRPARLPARALALVLALALGAGLLGGCSLLGGERPSPAATVPGPASDVPTAIRRVLDARAAALLAGDPAAFRRGLARDRRFRARQATYFENLRRLPVGSLRYVLDAGSVVREGAAYWAVVEVHLQLEGYDGLPVLTRDRYLFRPAAGRPGRLRLASVTDAAWERAHRVRPEPWETGPVVVRSGPGVLGIFDADSAHAAAALLGSVRRGIGEVSAVVPYAWSRSVVLYALSDTAVLDAVPELPGGEPQDVDALAFPVPAAPDDPTLAATRMVLHPRMLDAAGPERDRLLRHELTHVALGARAEAAPVWLSEGIAEYVSVQAMDPGRRRLPAAALEAARDGVRALPPDATFNGPDAAVNYALSWWACEYLVRRLAPAAPFALLDALQPGASGERGATADPERVLVELAGMGGPRLARHAARLIVQTYG